MHEILLALITQASSGLTVMFVFFIITLPISIVVARDMRGKKLKHVEEMATRRFAHEETMFKFSRELPQVVGSEKAIEYKQEQRRTD